MAEFNRRDFIKASLVTGAFGPSVLGMGHRVPVNGTAPNIVLIYADDIGYGDLGCYGATAVKTPHVDRLAQEGVRFTHGYAGSSTCTPSRYCLLTGQYAWRKPGTGILPADAALIIDPEKMSLPSMLKGAGYTTGVVGKWHLGLGDEKNKVDWNGAIKPGPLEIGFDYAFLIPATGDRVPCVYVEDHRVVGLDPEDPITVRYDQPIPGPAGETYTGPVRMETNPAHKQSVIHGIGRIGYMSGGRAALWKDEEIADTLAQKGVDFIEKNKANPFFLYFSTHDIHVPRVPHPRFVGATTMGPRGDAIVQFDFQVGQILRTLDRLGLAENTLVILSSDNGPVLIDAYQDRADEMAGDHKPAGPLRGGKYSIFDGGTCEPFLVRWPRRITPGVSEAFISQVDLVASLAALTGQELKAEDAPDSRNMLAALLGEDKTGRDHIIEHAQAVGLSIRIGDWKYIPPNTSGQRPNRKGLSPRPQLYHLKDDIGETHNLAEAYPGKVKEMADRLRAIKDAGRDRPL